MKVLLFVLGFPEKDNPNQGIFNFRAASSLAEHVDVSVLHLRMWKPGRHLFREIKSDAPFKHYVLALPMLPVTGPEKINSILTLTDAAIVIQYGNLFLKPLFENIDLIHSVGVSFGGIVGGAWAKKFKVHHVTQAIGSDVNVEIKALGKFKRGRIWVQSLHGVAANCADIKNKFLKLFPDTQNVKVVYRGVNLDHFKPVYTLSDAGFRFLFLGGLPEYPSNLFGRNHKGGITLMDAWRQIETHPEFKQVTLVFAGPDSDCELAQQWRDSLLYPDQVQLKGIVNPKDISELMRTSNVVVIPSMLDGMPNVGMEAGACGRPVLACETGGISEIVQHEKTGLLIPPGDVNSLAKMLLHSVKNPLLLQKYGMEARRRMETQFSSKNFVPELLNLYEQAMRLPVFD